MKRIIPIGLAVAVLSGLALPARAQSGVTDDAKMFTDGTVWKADDALLKVANQTGWQVVIQTINSLDGEPERDRAIAEARKLNIHGLYVLIARKEHKVWIQPSKSAEATFSHERVGAIRDALTNDFRRSDFDQGLLQAVEQIGKDAQERPRRRGAAGAPAGVPVEPANPPQPAPPAPRSTNVTGLVIVGGIVLLVLWALGKAFRRPQAVPAGSVPGQQPGPPPGYAPRPGPGTGPGGTASGYGYGPPPGPGYQGGPAYGPSVGAPPRQGGGFLSGMLGGLGGAVVGNILYDKFGRPIEHGVPTGTHPAGTVPPLPPDDAGTPPPAGESYDPAGGEGGDWGSAPPQGNEAAAAGAEGDWGAPPDQPQDESWNQDASAGGDWGGDASGPEGAGGDWGSDQNSDQDQDQDQGQGGDW